MSEGPAPLARLTAELSQLPGVDEVSIDLAGGTATIASTQPVDPDAVRAAVEEAGYQLAS